MTERSDAELIREFKEGNEGGFNELVRRYQERVYWVVRRFLPDHNDADDVVQEVFIRMYESLGGFREESSLFTWLYRIAVNLSLNNIRMKKLRRFLSIDEPLEAQLAGDEDPDKAVEGLEQRELIDKAVETLPEKQKAVFVLRYYEQLPYEEISRILKTSTGGLKANYYHAVRKIQDYVKRAYRPSND